MIAHHPEIAPGLYGTGMANMTVGASANAIAAFYDLTGAQVSRVAFADATGIGSAGWNFVEGPFQVPASAAYMAMGVQITVSGTLLYTDIRVQRA